MMWKSWSMSDSPGKSGSPVSISASRQPTAQISTSLRQIIGKNHACQITRTQVQISTCLCQIIAQKSCVSDNKNTGTDIHLSVSNNRQKSYMSDNKDAGTDIHLSVSNNRGKSYMSDNKNAGTSINQQRDLASLDTMIAQLKSRFFL